MRLKRIIKSCIFIIIVVLLGFYVKDHFFEIASKTEYLYFKYFSNQIRQNLIDSNYRKKINYEYLSINEDTIIENKNEIKDIIYTFLDGGWDEYMVKCDPKYTTCLDDIKEIIENDTYLTDIANFVHPFNSFQTINTTFTSTGKVTFKVYKKYSNEEINQINEKINQIYDENYNPKKNVKENIKIFHDYIINNTKYDKNNDSLKTNMPSATAYGTLFNKLAICSGYTETMQLLLEKMNVKNYRISSDTHIWNLVYIEGKWMPLDLTWDDPLTPDDTDELSDAYFLINTKELNEKNENEHIFNENIYLEAR